MKNKTVYILGAGFSIDAGAPLQSNIVEDIFILQEENSHLFQNGQIKEFRNFLTNTLFIQEELHSKIPLEDIFTPLDRCLADNISFRDLDVVQIKKIRELIYHLIGITLKHKLQDVNKEYVDKFAKHLFDQCKLRKNKNYSKIDSVSVISTNWDILLDNSIKEIIETSRENAVVDYCCYISSHNADDITVKPGLEILGQGGFNIKLLKLHGSYNWLQCPRCLRVYVEFNEKIAVNQFENKNTCRYCDVNFGSKQSHILTSNLIMPTFLKDFSNPQYKLIWQNAGVELAEATKIVFIGYSLPQADFEMRQLLSRMIREDAEIEVITKGSLNKQSTIDLKERYDVFFGKREPKFFYEGVTHYINNNLN
jgi:NAD-dependent SIR2 family protein deacetylase